MENNCKYSLVSKQPKQTKYFKIFPTFTIKDFSTNISFYYRFPTVQFGTQIKDENEWQGTNPDPCSSDMSAQRHKTILLTAREYWVMAGFPVFHNPVYIR